VHYVVYSWRGIYFAVTAIAASLLYAKVEDSSEVSYLSKEEKRMSKTCQKHEDGGLALAAAIFGTIRTISRVDLRE
jgi:hypothetical protein